MYESWVTFATFRYSDTVTDTPNLWIVNHQEGPKSEVPQVLDVHRYVQGPSVWADQTITAVSKLVTGNSRIQTWRYCII